MHRIFFSLVALAIVGIVWLFLTYAPHKEPASDIEIGDTQHICNAEGSCEYSLSVRNNADTNAHIELDVILYKVNIGEDDDGEVVEVGSGVIIADIPANQTSQLSETISVTDVPDSSKIARRK